MGNCGTKPKTSDGDDAPSPAEQRTPAPAAEGERKDEEVAGAAPEEASHAVVAPQSEEATTTTDETKEPDEPKEKQEVPREDADQGKEKETPTTEGPGELPASTPASVA
ncbi:hypothetical protein SEVIR_3G232901v4 [Setaria viridis]|uniref:Uncharacterized protein n=1 Tax=Setaria viridis TaxID=4556 RepID=A0A4U6VGE9_SETVI|nr:uncharacterized protein LOC117850531 [Setaria viridis]TKW27063.1 hypothetical protein SEVIR_3G232901v2 [Setaria viridis]